MNNVIMSTNMQVFMWPWTLNSHDHVPRSRTAGQTVCVTFLRNYQTVFQNVRTTSQSHQLHITALFLCQLSLLFIFLIIAMLVGVKSISMSLVCISLITGDAECLLKHSLAVCISSLHKCLF